MVGVGVCLPNHLSGDSFYGFAGKGNGVYMFYNNSEVWSHQKDKRESEARWDGPDTTVEMNPTTGKIEYIVGTDQQKQVQKINRKLHSEGQVYFCVSLRNTDVSIL